MFVLGVDFLRTEVVVSVLVGGVGRSLLRFWNEVVPCRLFHAQRGRRCVFGVTRFDIVDGAGFA